LDFLGAGLTKEGGLFGGHQERKGPFKEGISFQLVDWPRNHSLVITVDWIAHWFHIIVLFYTFPKGATG